jgi:hypothetical protein
MPSAVPQSLWKDYIQSLEQARLQRQDAWGGYRDSASRERRRFKEKYRHQRSLLAALPISGRDRKRLSQQLALDDVQLCPWTIEMALLIAMEATTNSENHVVEITKCTSLGARTGQVVR